MSFSLLGVRIEKISSADAIRIIKEALVEKKQFKLYTPNPEMLVKAQGDVYFRNILNAADLNICDGRGIQFFASEKIERISGVDLMLSICALAESENRSIYLLGSGDDNVVAQTKKNLLRSFPKLSVAGFDKGPIMKENDVGELMIDSEANEMVLKKIATSEPAILFVAFGMGKQEKWIDKYITKLPSVGVAMGVGGAFDFISEKIPRAPLLLRKLGLEWLYRLIRQPTRIGRIFNAIIRFSYLALRSTI
ncbi:MAG: hypothetical protein A3I29_02510 [Candidatus Magasanikbacteria bacterium RIFCSPLOWO2_02_FULL_44_11]|uniref:Glycosyltransferase n=1 Tax=Candidatus Magasanikbacteria bacterium RIFCSPLOWO2_02_FULL_44_11 TaxID=1798689 RepID=A0A1F6NBV2_9BACT|nr:MAG: hypothetical protein A3I29_02510 [Candidatus Magasanikbacteria bacterium RIFCSPLOWO2_02_FULL_44_11]